MLIDDENTLAELQQDKFFFKLPLDFFPDEDWKPYPNNPDYFISTYGRVYSIKRKTLLTADRYRNYWKFELSQDGKRSKVNAARLVAITYLDMPDDDKHHAHHINGKRYDNRLCNISPPTAAQHLLIHKLYKEADTEQRKAEITQAVIYGGYGGETTAMNSN